MSKTTGVGVPPQLAEAVGWLVMDEWPDDSEEFALGAAMVLLSRGEPILEDIEERAEAICQYLPMSSRDSDLKVARP